RVRPAGGVNDEFEWLACGCLAGVVMSRTLILLLWLIAAVGSLPSRASMADETVEANSQLGEYLVAGWLAERQKIEWADVVVEGDFEIDLADYRSKKFRIESLLSPTVDRYESNWAPKLATSWLEYSDHIVMWNHGWSKAGTIRIYPDREAHKKDCARVDPRLAPLHGLQAIPDRLPRFEHLEQGYLRGLILDDIREVAPGVYECTMRRRFEVPNPATYSSRWRINENRGFSLERTELYERLPGQEEPGHRLSWCETEWDQIADVWVPVGLKAEQVVVSTGEVARKVELTFQWDSVNEPIPAARFDLLSFDVSDGHVITDHRNPDQKPVEVGRVQRSKTNVSDPPKFDRFLDPTVSPPPPPPAVQSASIASPRVILVVAFNIVVLLVGVVAFRRSRRRTTPE
ncbi:MAG: hypothetical protein KDA96_18695, partial [Planctomycetaceae bacterium]|nr:hypothetical protein [Planctomycetaceae bacterium]